MQVKKIMTQHVVTIPVTAGLEEAVALMKQFDIRHLPVVKGKKLIGLVTQGDLRGALFPAILEDIGVKDLMITNVITVTPETMLEDAARLVYRHKIGCLPVVDEKGELKGIVTVADMLAALIELMGFLSTSSRLDVILQDRPDALEQACRIIQEHGGRIIGISLTQLGGRFPVHLFRLEKTDLDGIVATLNQAGHMVVSSLS